MSKRVHPYQKPVRVLPDGSYRLIAPKKPLLGRTSVATVQQGSSEGVMDDGVSAEQLRDDITVMKLMKEKEQLEKELLKGRPRSDVSEKKYYDVTPHRSLKPIDKAASGGRYIGMFTQAPDILGATVFPRVDIVTPFTRTRGSAPQFNELCEESEFLHWCVNPMRQGAKTGERVGNRIIIDDVILNLAGLHGVVDLDVHIVHDRSPNAPKMFYVAHDESMLKADFGGASTSTASHLRNCWGLCNGCPDRVTYGGGATYPTEVKSGVAQCHDFAAFLNSYYEPVISVESDKTTDTTLQIQHTSPDTTKAQPVMSWAAWEHSAGLTPATDTPVVSNRYHSRNLNASNFSRFDVLYREHIRLSTSDTLDSAAALHTVALTNLGIHTMYDDDGYITTGAIYVLILVQRSHAGIAADSTASATYVGVDHLKLYPPASISLSSRTFYRDS